MKGSEIGYILNSDMTVTSTTQSGKTPIGVVVCSYAGGGGQAIALKKLNYVQWASEEIDVSGLTNHANSKAAYKETSSCSNSQKIMDAGDASKFPAVWTAYNYSTSGTNIGDWCLPAAGTITSIFANMDLLNNSIKKVGGEQFSSSFWSSSESILSRAWYFISYVNYGLSNYSSSATSKKGRSYVRPVLEF